MKKTAQERKFLDKAYQALNLKGKLMNSADAEHNELFEFITNIDDSSRMILISGLNKSTITRNLAQAKSLFDQDNYLKAGSYLMAIMNALLTVRDYQSQVKARVDGITIEDFSKKRFQGYQGDANNIERIKSSSFQNNKLVKTAGFFDWFSSAKLYKLLHKDRWKSLFKDEKIIKDTELIIQFLERYVGILIKTFDTLSDALKRYDVAAYKDGSEQVVKVINSINDGMKKYVTDSFEPFMLKTLPAKAADAVGTFIEVEAKSKSDVGTNQSKESNKTKLVPNTSEVIDDAEHEEHSPTGSESDDPQDYVKLSEKSFKSLNTSLRSLNAKYSKKLEDKNNLLSEQSELIKSLKDLDKNSQSYKDKLKELNRNTNNVAKATAFMNGLISGTTKHPIGGKSILKEIMERFPDKIPFVQARSSELFTAITNIDSVIDSSADSGEQELSPVENVESKPIVPISADKKDVAGQDILPANKLTPDVDDSIPDIDEEEGLRQVLLVDKQEEDNNKEPSNKEPSNKELTPNDDEFYATLDLKSIESLDEFIISCTEFKNKLDRLRTSARQNLNVLVGEEKEKLITILKNANNDIIKLNTRIENMTDIKAKLKEKKSQSEVSLGKAPEITKEDDSKINEKETLSLEDFNKLSSDIIRVFSAKKSDINKLSHIKKEDITNANIRIAKSIFINCFTGSNVLMAKEILSKKFDNFPGVVVSALLNILINNIHTSINIFDKVKGNKEIKQNLDEFDSGLKVFHELKQKLSSYQTTEAQLKTADLQIKLSPTKIVSYDNLSILVNDLIDSHQYKVASKLISETIPKLKKSDYRYNQFMSVMVALGK